MKKFTFLAIFAILLTASIFAEHIGRMQVSDSSGSSKIAQTRIKMVLSEKYLQQEITKGNLLMVQNQQDTLFPGNSHHRYQQFYQGLPVFGAEIIIEYKNGQNIGVTGEYYKIDSISMDALLTPQQAVEALAQEMGVPAILEKPQDVSRLIYPISDGEYRLAYKVKLRIGDMNYETALVDALDGKIYAHDTNVKTETIIGLGKDYHGVNRKFPHTFENNTYYLWDDKTIRPAKLVTYDMRTGGYPGQGSDKYWQGNGTMISAHYHVGLAYDFLYTALNLKGFDNHNHDMLVVTHRTEMSDNASWNGTYLNFFVPGSGKSQYAATLDVVTHECAHAVTEHASNLVYSFESGALNESFSDIMGTAAEFYWQPAGSGFNKADWYTGEDAFPTYAYGINNGLVRSLSNPNAFSQFGNPSYPDPCHLSQYYDLPFGTDRGGVHINMTIFPHAFYLLANGGTNRISHKSVTSIGIDKALRIFYRAWVNKLTSGSQFINAAQALLDSAVDLYGRSSVEHLQTIRAIEAIGYTVN